MKITFLSDAGSWKNEAISSLVKKLRHQKHHVTFVHNAESVGRGDVLFILGFFKIVPPSVLARHSTNIVIHESALPKGRGWSPVSWLVLEGQKTIPLTLFEAVERVDAGNVYARGAVRLKGDELLPEIHEKVASVMMTMCEKFIARYPSILKKGVSQTGKATYYAKRTPNDSRLDPKKSLAHQFNLLRIVDNNAYPAFFTHRGSTYLLKIEKKND